MELLCHGLLPALNLSFSKNYTSNGAPMVLGLNFQDIRIVLLLLHIYVKRHICNADIWLKQQCALVCVFMLENVQVNGLPMCIFIWSGASFRKCEIIYIDQYIKANVFFWFTYCVHNAIGLTRLRIAITLRIFGCVKWAVNLFWKSQTPPILDLYTV